MPSPHAPRFVPFWYDRPVHHVVETAIALVNHPDSVIVTDDPVTARELFWRHLRRSPRIVVTDDPGDPPEDDPGLTGPEQTGRLVTLVEAARIAGVTEMTIRNRLKDGRLTEYRTRRGARRVAASELTSDTSGGE